MNKFFKWFGIFALFVTSAIGIVFYFTNKLTQSAEHFFTNIQAGHLEEAFEQTGQGFKQGTSFETFKIYVEEWGLNEYEKAFWSSRNISGSEGTLEGTITLNDQTTLPIEMAFIKEEGEWKIYGVNLKNPGLAGDVLTIPSKADLEALTYATLARFGAALETQDFTAFHDSIAEFWKGQITPEALKEAFQNFIDAEIKFTLGGAVPIFNEPPVLDEDNVLALKGYVMLGEVPMNFELSYIYEFPEWKLIRININF